MKVVKNCCYGGFALSKKALNRLTELTGKKIKWNSYNNDEMRTAPELIQVVEELGIEANGVASYLGIVDIPDNIDWYISNYDGIETIEEKHRRW